MTNEMVGDEWSDAQEDLRRLFEENGHPMWVRDGPQIVAVNRAALIHYGYSRDEFLALTISDLVVMDARDEPYVAKAPATNVAEHPHALPKHRRKDGSFVDVEVTSFAVTFRRRPASLDSIVDVTYRSKTEAQANLPRVILLATVTDAVVASDEKFVLTDWNAAAESIPLEDARTRCSDSLTRSYFAPASSASSARRRSEGWSKRDVFMAS